MKDAGLTPAVLHAVGRLVGASTANWMLAPSLGVMICSRMTLSMVVWPRAKLSAVMEKSYVVMSAVRTRRLPDDES